MQNSKTVAQRCISKHELPYQSCPAPLPLCDQSPDCCTMSPSVDSFLQEALSEKSPTHTAPKLVAPEPGALDKERPPLRPKSYC